MPATAVTADDPTPWQTGDPTFTPATRKPAIIGVNYHGTWDDYTDTVRTQLLDKMAAAGVTWVRLDIAWAALQPNGPDSYDLSHSVPRLDQRINEIAARGMKTLLLVYWAPSWSSGTSAMNGVPRDPQEYGNAVAWAAQRWRGKVAAIEVWNQPDVADFLANQSVATYTGLVTAAYQKVKAVTPETIVVAGAPSAVKTDWYREFYRLGGADSYDALGVHAYMGMSDAPPAACDTNYIQFYPCNVPNLVKLMQDNGDGDKKIWATEYGWSAHNNSAYANPPPPWKRGVTVQQQAEYLLQMQQYLAQWPQVEATFWYTDRNVATGDAQWDNFGLLNRDLTTKPAYYAMKCAATGICGPTPWQAGDPTFTPPPRKPSIIGVNYHGIWDSYADATDRVRLLDKLAAAGVKWVRMDIAWAALQPDGPGSYDMSEGVPKIDQRIDEIHAHGMKVLLLVWWAPSWSSGTTAGNGVPRDPEEYGDAVAWAAQRWRGKVAAIEVWNEPDLSDFLANESVETFTNLVKAAYHKIKAVAPETIVVSGATTAPKTDWFREFYRLGGADHYDVLGIHTFMGVIDAPPSTCVAEFMQYFPCNIPNLVQVMRDNGDGDKKIWSTEYGWSSFDDSVYSDPPPWIRGVTLQEQADYLIEMQDYLGQWPQVEAAFWYTDRNQVTGSPLQDNFGLLTRDLTYKPVYFAMKCAAAGICGPSVTVPAAPTGLTVTSNGTDRINLNWNAVGGATGYKVFRNGTQVATVTGTSHTDTGLTAATTYTYTVAAVNAAGTGPASTAVSATTAPITSYLKSGAIWKVNDSGTNLGTAWRAVGFDDRTWRSGPTQLGYGDGDERTLLNWGTNPTKKPITYFARTSFDAGPSVADVKSVTLRALVDDGAVVYLNGQEAWRFNLPTGTISFTTRASRAIAGAEENQWRSVTIPAAALRAGANSVAVEVHNDAPSSSDISLDLELSPLR